MCFGCTNDALELPNRLYNQWPGLGGPTISHAPLVGLVEILASTLFREDKVIADMLTLASILLQV